MMSKNKKGKKILFVSDDDQLDFLSDDDDIPKFVLYEDDDINHLPTISEEVGKSRRSRSLSPPFIKKCKTEGPEGPEGPDVPEVPVDPLMEKIYNTERDIRELDSNDNFDVRQRLLLLDIDISLKASILAKLDQPAGIFGGDQNKITSWVNNLTRIPFGVYKNIQTNLKDPLERSRYLEMSKQCLDDVSYGNINAKEQILEYIAKYISMDNCKGNVIALKGAAGTGKTSLIRRGLSKVLERPFYCINFGGLTDPTLLVGHSSTYVGSKYGRLVDILIKSKCMNPIIYLDEIDKISGLTSNSSTEIFGVLTHLLDEEQNQEFLDNYFDGVKIDMSKVLFVLSFNEIENIDKIVRDRIKVIEVNEPSIDDKVKIARDYLLPEILSEFKLGMSINFSDKVLKKIISKKVEPGVRGLKKNLETIIEKINLKLIVGDTMELSYDIKLGQESCEVFEVTENLVECLLKGSVNELVYNHFYI